MSVIETISLLCPLAIMLEENFVIAEKHSFEFLLNKNIIKAPSREYCQGSQQTTKLKGKTDSKAVSCCSRGIKRDHKTTYRLRHKTLRFFKQFKCCITPFNEILGLKVG